MFAQSKFWVAVLRGSDVKSVFSSVYQTIHEAMPTIPLSVLRALFESVGQDQSRLLVEVQRG